MDPFNINTFSELVKAKIENSDQSQVVYSELEFQYIINTCLVHYLKRTSGIKAKDQLQERFDFIEKELNFGDESFDNVFSQVPFSDVKINSIYDLPDLDGYKISKFKQELNNNGLKYTIESLKTFNKLLFSDKNKKILLLDNIATSKHFNKIKEQLIFDVYLTGTELNKEFITHGRISHVIHQFIVNTVINTFISDCTRNRTFKDDNIINKLLKAGCRYITINSKSSKEIFETIIDGLIKIMCDNLYVFGKTLEIKSDKLISTNSREVWGILFDTGIRQNPIEKTIKWDKLTTSDFNLYNFLCVPDNITLLLLANNNWPKLSYIIHVSNYISIEMSRQIHLIIKHKVPDLNNFKDFIFNGEDIWYYRTFGDESFNKLKSHYTGGDSNMPISDKLSPMNPYHTRQIFLRTIKEMNIQDANELICMFDCESNIDNKNCLFNSAHTDTVQDHPYFLIDNTYYENKYLKYKSKYQNLKKLF